VGSSISRKICSRSTSGLGSPELSHVLRPWKYFERKERALEGCTHCGVLGICGSGGGLGKRYISDVKESSSGRAGFRFTISIALFL